MKLLESIIPGGIFTNEQYSSVSTAAKSAEDTMSTNGTNRLDDIAPLQHQPSASPASDWLRQASRMASELLANHTSDLRDTKAAVLDKAAAAVQRALKNAERGDTHNLEFALKMQSDARADAFSHIGLAIQAHRMTQDQAISPWREQLMTKSTLDSRHEMAPSSSVGGAKHGLGASAADDPDTSTPAAVDAITINSLEELKAYYAQYAADYQALSAYVQENVATDPTDCDTAIQAFASKYSAPLIVNAGIDPAYASVVLGGDWEISEISLPGKGTFEAYRLNLGGVQSYFDDQAFCDRLQNDMDVAGLIWNASAGHDRDHSVTPPSYSKVYAALQKLEASFGQTSHVSVLPDNLPDFYTTRPDPAGGYFVEPSDKFKKIIKACDAYLAAWRTKYGGGTPTDNQTFDQDDTDPKLESYAHDVYGYAGSWLAQSIDNKAWLAKITQYTPTLFESWNPDVARADANLDSLARSDAAQYGGLKSAISEAKSGIIDIYGDLISEYVDYTQSITSLVADLSKYVKAADGDKDGGSKVTFEADDFRSEMQAQIDELSQWSMTIPGTSALSVDDWSKELKGNFVATKNADGTTTLKLDLTNLIAMRDSLDNYSNADISVTQYNAWYSGFTSQKDNVQNLSQSIAEKFSRMNSTFDNLVRMMSSVISALLESEQKYFQF